MVHSSWLLFMYLYWIILRSPRVTQFHKNSDLWTMLQLNFAAPVFADAELSHTTRKMPRSEYRRGGDRLDR